MERMLYLKDVVTLNLNEEKCIGCLACVDACPFGAIQINPDGDVLKCDLCGGDPVCVKYCPPRPAHSFPHTTYPRASCLEYVEPHRVTRKEIKAKDHNEVKSE